MKKILTLAIVMAISQFSVNAQCKKKIDEFTKDTTISNELKKIGKNKEGTFDYVKFLEAEIYKLNSTFVLVLVPQFRTIQTIDKGEKVYIKFADDSIIELEVRKTSISNHTTGEMITQGSDTIIWYNYLSFILTDTNVQDLKTKKIKKIRCGINDYIVKESSSDILIEQLNCINSKS